MLFAAGCASVHVPRPVGEKPHALKPSDWEGTWIIGRDVACVRVTDAAHGWLKTTSFKDHESDPSGAALEVSSIQIMESGHWLFANVRDDSVTPARYTWGRIRLEGDQAIVWEPDLEKFRALVRAGKLKGQLDGDSVALEALSPDDVQALTSGALGLPLAWDKPLVLRRVARAEEK